MGAGLLPRISLLTPVVNRISLLMSQSDSSFLKAARAGEPPFPSWSRGTLTNKSTRGRRV